jgi:hypothetical protein
MTHIDADARDGGNVTAEHRGQGDRGRTRPARTPSRRRVVAVALAMALATATLAVVGSTSLSPFHAANSGAASVCQSDGTSGCSASLPCASGPCATVDVSPATSLSDDQYVFVKATDFPTGDSMRIALCSTVTSTTDPSCLNGQWEANQWGPVQVPIAENTQGNATQTAVPVFFDQSGEGNNPLPAHDVTNSVGVVPGFFCDNSADPCAIEVTEEVGTGNTVGDGPPDSASNTVVVPLNFAAQNGGCPASDTEIQTDSSFSLEHFLPAAVDATCGASNGVVALNTATDNETVASDFAAGGAQIGFIDDPADPGQQAAVAGKAYAYIPIAVSGTAVGMLAAESDAGGTAFPVSSYDLTPNMVAGLITSEYQTAQGSVQAFSPYNFTNSDNLMTALGNANPPVTCENLLGCPYSTKRNGVQAERNWEKQEDAFQLVNPVSSDDYGPSTFGSFDSDVPSGSSYQVTNWLCNAPDSSYTVGVDEVGQSGPVPVSVTDTNTAPTTFTTAPIGSTIWPPGGAPGTPWVFPDCEAYAAFPSLAGTASDYGESQSPALQAKSIRSFAYGGNSVPSIPFPDSGLQAPPAGFGVMDSSEAAFYGLNTASLQNADGAFEAPTVSSLTAAESGFSACPIDDPSCPAGTFTLDYTGTTSAGAYPMPDITYAMVSTTPQPAAQAKAEANLLDNLVTYSHNGGGSIALPAGYAPLSDTLYQAALTDIADDIVAEPSGSSSTPGSSSAANATSSSGGSSEGNAGTSSGGYDEGSSGSGYDGGSSSNGALPLSGSAQNGKSSGGSNGSGRGAAGAGAPSGFLLVSLDAAARFLLPAIVALALACLIAGPLLLFLPEIRRRRRGAGGPS